MKENGKIENNVGPPEQKSGSDSSTQPNNCSRASGNGSCHTADKGRPTTIHQSTNPVIRVARAPRAKYKHRNHRRTGKVARLPSAIRHEICLMFTRYTEYKDIIAWLASQGHPGISESNLSRWRKGGFLDWVRRDQEKRLDLITMALEVLEELVKAEKKVQPASDQSQPFGVPPSGGPTSSTDNGPLTTDSPRFNKP